MKTLTSALVTIAALSASANADQINHQVLRQAEQQQDLGHRKLTDVLKNVNVEAALNVDFSILKGLDTGFRYTYAVQPAYQSGIYTRVDRYTPHAKLTLPKVMVEIEPGAEVVFLRQYPSEFAAAKATPRWDLHKIPLNAENALALNPGDLVMLPVSLNLMVGPDGGVNYGPLELFGRAQYVMRGAYQIQALRLADNRVRLRLIATRQRGIEGEGGARLSLDIFELGLANKALNAVFGKRIGSIGFGKTPRGLVMADYIFNLNDQTARDAYNHLLSADRLLTNFKLVNPAVGQNQLQKMFVSDLSNVDAIAAEDAAKKFDDRRIVQIFKGRSSGTTTSWGFGVNIFHFAAYRQDSSVSPDNHVVFLDSDNDQKDYLAPINQRDKHLSLLFGLRSEEENRKAEIITPVDANGHPTKMGEFVVTVELKDKHMGVSETERALENLKRNVAPSIIDRMNITPLLTATSYTNARIYAQVIFNERAVNDLALVSKAQFVQAFEKHLTEVRTQLGDKKAADWVQGHNFKIWELSDRLVAALNPQQTIENRIRGFMDIQKDSFFRAVGTGVLMSLFRQEQLDQLISVYLRMDATAFQAPVEATFGTSDFRSVVKVTEYIEHMLDHGAFDLRLETFGTTTVANGQVISLKSIGEGK